MLLQAGRINWKIGGFFSLLIIIIIIITFSEVEVKIICQSKIHPLQLCIPTRSAVDPGGITD